LLALRYQAPTRRNGVKEEAAGVQTKAQAQGLLGLVPLLIARPRDRFLPILIQNLFTEDTLVYIHVRSSCLILMRNESNQRKILRKTEGMQVEVFFHMC
jgi:hypothetical protein